MKILGILSHRRVAILAAALVFPILGLTWLFGGGRISAQSDDTRQPTVVEAATGTGFTYQGQLNDGGMPANGTYSFQFGLFDTAVGGNQIGSFNQQNIVVNNGLFTATLNNAGEYGASAFTGEARYLEIRVSSNGVNYTMLTPRQPLTAVPYALSLRPGALISSTQPAASVLNLTNTGLDGSGLFIDAAGTGMFVNSTAGDGLSVDATNNGLLIDSAATGVNVTTATSDGVAVTTAPTGVHIYSATDTGLRVNSAAGSGYMVDSADFGARVTDARIGYFVERATQTGMQVNSAITGMYVLSATNGIWIESASSNGVRIQNAAQKGVLIATAREDGVYVANAGSPISSASSSQNNGFEIAGAEGSGLFVGYAAAGVRVNSASEGIRVDSTSSNGIRIVSAGFDGVAVYSAGNDGLYVGAASGDGIDVTGTVWAGNFHGPINVSGTCTGCLIAVFAVNNGGSALQPGDIVSLNGMRTSRFDNTQPLLEVGLAGTGDAVIGVVAGSAEIVTETNPSLGENVESLAPRDGAAQPGEYVHIVVFGPMQVRASALGSAIQMGDKLSVNSSGAARSLQTRMLDGMSISESAPTLGTALEGLDANQDGLIWVLVNPQ
ncbi:MAG: hypothetical protein KBE23_21360 [Chloroflexi bacterium]|nr:hypothetical protein [Chloroflexota bacterium]MBP7045314.1 hypothetical protein [Chloroflexota bacterium]